MLPQEDLPAIEGDMSDKFSQKIDDSDGKSIDSSRLAEDDEDEDEVIVIFALVIFCNFARTNREEIC